MTIKDAYYKKIEAKGFNIDPIQLQVVEAYDRLKTKIKNDEPKVNQTKLNIFQKIFKPLTNHEHAYEYSNPRGLYIYGEVGRGKTFLMDLFYENIDIPKMREHYYHFMQEIHQKLRQLKGETDPLKQVAKEFARDYKVMCIDEFHVIDITDAMILYRLIDALLQEGIFFVTTSNREPSDLYKGGLQREQFLPAIKLIETRLKNIPLDSQQDYRLRHLESADIWFTGNDNAQIENFEKKFEELIGKIKGPITMDVNGHRFEMVKRTEEAAWFTFDEACRKPRSSQDFIRLAQCFETVFFSGLPQLTKELRDEARRFIIMVDEFYDQGIKLVIGSSVEMTQLYAVNGEQALDFEFDRTLSRLIEMQSQDYLNQPRRHNRECQCHEIK